MSLQSMTGFARLNGEGLGYRWILEMKSVNGKGLDIRCRVPAFLDGLDISIKKAIGNSVRRGTVFVSLSVERGEEADGFTVNRPRLEQLIALGKEYRGVEAPRLDGLLRVKGVLDLGIEALDDKIRKDLVQVILQSVEDCIAELKRARGEEGARMADALNAHLNDIAEHTDKAANTADARLEGMKARFQANLDTLLEADPPISEDRLAQEIAILAVKADIREEIDRLHSHVADARSVMASEGPVGRRLDFLAQEFNREANTLCSKAGDTELTRIGIGLKTVIDQFREQVQNIE